MLRLARARDAAVLRRFFTAQARHSAALSGETDPLVVALLAERSMSATRAAIARHRGALMLVTRRGEVLGMGAVVLATLPLEPGRLWAVSPGGAPRASLTGLWIDPDHRRQGFGARLVRAAGRCAAKRGAGPVAAQVEQADDAARAFYSALGFDLDQTRII